MAKKDEALELAKRIFALESEIARLQADLVRLKAEWGKFFSEERKTNGELSPEPVDYAARFAGDTPERVLRFMAAHPDRAFGPAQLAKELSIPSKRIRNALFRFTKSGDRRLMKTGNRGLYKFHSMSKETHQ
jgi:hypothetical protein